MQDRDRLSLKKRDSQTDLLASEEDEPPKPQTSTKEDHVTEICDELVQMIRAVEVASHKEFDAFLQMMKENKHNRHFNELRIAAQRELDK